MKTTTLLPNQTVGETINTPFFKGKNEPNPLVKPFIQAKLTVNEPGDEYEQEADAVADKVMRMPAPALISPSNPPDENKNKIQLKPIPFSQIFRKCAACEEEEKVQRKESTGGGRQTAPPIVNDVISSSGKSLDGNTQQFMESRIGHDFSHVQVHTDSKAAESASSVNALAYTSGNHIVFNSGQYAPNTEGGKRLLAHELVHVGQQGNGVNRMIQRDCCADAKTAGINRSSIAGVICCNKIKHACVWKSGGAKRATNATAIKIVDHCGVVHEEDHFDDVDCPDTIAANRPPFKAGKVAADEEKKAYKAEQTCLEGKIADCGASEACKTEVNKELTYIKTMT